MLIPFGVFSAAGAGGGAGGGSFDLLETILISSNTASVTFDTSTYAALGYKHLQIRMVTKLSQSGTATDQRLRFNGVTSTSYAAHRLLGNGSSVVSQNYTSATSSLIGLVDGDQFTAGVIDILDPFSSTKNKTVRCLFGVKGNASEVMLTSGLFYDTTITSSITLFPIVYNYLAGSRLSIYGLKG